ncbi:DUF2020 domain-containing protein [Corynebacterium aquilae]|uniref:DUF2020 domain-containing protein n=1 Tax=Corynebacterium aquilae DSM 44791 TaxID=1431546 RepID=A0A1L7CIK4_9CORY|nr:DUF2020 domain-containing protein [Corynebacterium aquilae]APT85692.1 hypothetical protein CAQU_12320 [Corynebacterium aquilae DSM 44791]
MNVGRVFSPTVRRATAASLVVAGCALGACSAQPDDTAASPTGPELASTTPPAAEQPAADEGLPFDTLPMIPAGREDFTDCPYLDTTFVADTNGQKVTGQGIDTRFDTPACVFWSYPEEPQLTVLVRHMHTPQQAKEVVDWAAPVDATSPASEPQGWDGGRGSLGPESSVYAVFKDTVAVVVFSNQQQSIKPQLVAEKAIENLGL